MFRQMQVLILDNFLVISFIFFLDYYQKTWKEETFHAAKEGIKRKERTRTAKEEKSHDDYI